MTWKQEGYQRQDRPRIIWRRKEDKRRERAGWRSWSEVSTAKAKRAGSNSVEAS